MQLLGAADPVVPSLPQVGLVRAEQARPGQAHTGDQLISGGGGGVAADRLAFQFYGAADLGDGQSAGQGGVDLGMPGPGPCGQACLRGWRGLGRGRPAIRVR